MIRLANKEDFEEILPIYQYARQYMKEHHNPNQWKDDRPRAEVLFKDIEKQQLYVIEENNHIVGVFAFIIGIDETYLQIDGKWLNDQPYGVIHRIASNGTTSGIMHKALEFAFSKINNIRIDTHQDNKTMQYLLEKEGFSYCGTIITDDGTPRLALQKSIDMLQ